MYRHLKLALAAGGVALAIVCAAVNAMQKAEAPAKKPGPATPRNEQLESDSGRIFRAGGLLGREVRTADGTSVGKVDDVLIDLDEGHLALVLVSVGGDGKEQKRVGVPPDALARLGVDEVIGVDASSDQFKEFSRIDAAKRFTRQMVAKAYAQFDRDIYWDREIRTDDEALDRLTELRNTSVRNARGAGLGAIQDFAMTTQGRVAYAGLATTTEPDRLYPIPLSAFVVPNGAKEWVVDLPKDIVQNTPTFPAREWPKTIDRGWSEYVHVQYGRSPLAGVNRQVAESATSSDQRKVK
ncbi:MAG: PRC-barrel domain-containing protein [Planctomycetia bacterium]|nr:PRC-barrel domain-containing protein [Planctomycetia bacterium]